MDFKHLSEKMSELQDKIQDVDDKIKAIEATKESGAGLVKATVNGTKKILRLEIDEQLLVKEEKEMLQDLIVAAVNLAIDEIEEKTKGERQQASIDLLGSLTQE
jgi:DNA-binding YbaB/EbfC family protein